MKQGPWLGLDIGASKILGVAIGDGLELLGSERASTGRAEGRARVLQTVVGIASKLIESHGPAAGVGVGFAGLVDPRQGIVLSSIMVPAFERTPLAEILTEVLEARTFVDNDATAAGYGELCALGRPVGLSMVVLTVGTGIGGALVIDGKLYRGAKGLAGEVGNMTIDWQGQRCWCGALGCLNMLASGSAIEQRAADLGDGQPSTLREVEAAAAGGDPRAIAALAHGAQALGAGIANLINLLNPDRVVLTGGVAMLGETFLEQVRASAKARAFAESFAHATIERSRLGYEAGAVGAACLARDWILHGGLPA